MSDILDSLDSIVWGLPTIALLLGTGLYLTIILRGLQFTMLTRSLRLAFLKREEGAGEGDISHFQALMTALCATVGTGNIAGVATAIAVGGPGAVFWMWVTGLVGMATKYAEAVLAVKYRYRDEKGNMIGGPMVYIAKTGRHRFWKILAGAFAVFACVASFGIGNMTQSNSVADALYGAFGAPKPVTGVILAIMTAVVILGGMMATKYAEAVLAVKYRYRDEKGNMIGGPMVYIAKTGRHRFWKILAGAFAVFACVASFGIGNMTQSNSVADALYGAFGAPKPVTGVILAIMTAVVILGGIKWIGRVASVIVPLMILFYCSSAIWIIVTNMEMIPGAISLIFHHAFSSTAQSGGFAGSAVWVTMRMGVARGIFSNESGLGSSPIAAASARTKEPVAQALVSMTQTFIDTIIVCSMTALVIIISGAWDSGATGSALTSSAFSATLAPGLGGAVVSISLAFFAYSTLLGWSYYGERALESLVGARGTIPYKIIFCIFIYVGAVSRLDTVWLFSDVANGLMALPNLVALVMLAPVIKSETLKYLADHNTPPAAPAGSKHCGG